jgi:hypothetical protein
LTVLLHEVNEQMEHLQYHHFPSHAGEGAEAVVMPVGDCGHIGCFTDQVQLTHCLVQDLDEAVKELLGDHEDESSQKIMKLEALCKRLREDAQKLREEKATLEGMIKSCDELLMEMAEEYGLNHMGENDNDEDEDNEGNTIGPPAPMPHAAALEEIVKDEAPIEMVPEQEAPLAHEAILADAELELLLPRLFNMIMRNYEESTPRMVNGSHELDDLDDLDDSTEADYNVDEWFPEDGSNDRD